MPTAPTPPDSRRPFTLEEIRGLSTTTPEGEPDKFDHYSVLIQNTLNAALERGCTREHVFAVLDLFDAAGWRRYMGLIALGLDPNDIPQDRSEKEN
jgi:hypothetical protein